MVNFHFVFSLSPFSMPKAIKIRSNFQNEHFPFDFITWFNKQFCRLYRIIMEQYAKGIHIFCVNKCIEDEEHVKSFWAINRSSFCLNTCLLVYVTHFPVRKQLFDAYQTSRTSLCTNATCTSDKNLHFKWPENMLSSTKRISFGRLNFSGMEWNSSSVIPKVRCSAMWWPPRKNEPKLIIL